MAGIIANVKTKLQRGVISFARKYIVPSDGFRDYWREITGIDLPGVRTDYRSLASDAYMKNSAVYAAVNEVATAFSAIPWKVVTGLDTDDEEPQDGHPFNLVLARPNPQMSWAQFMYAAASTYLINGGVHVRRPPGQTGPDVRLTIMRPDLMEAIADAEGNPVAWKYRRDSDGLVEIIPVEEICFIKAWHPLNTLKGLSKIQPIAMEIDAVNESTEWNANLLRNGARPDGVLSAEGNLTDEQFEQMKERLQKQSSGVRRARTPLLLEGGLSWQQTSMPPTELDWLNGQTMNRRQIYSAFNVAAQLVGDEASKTYANYAEARKALYTEAVIPLAHLFRDEFNWWLKPQLGDGIALDYDTTHIDALKDNENDLWGRHIKAVAGRIETVNEARAAIGLDQSDEAHADELTPPPTFGADPETDNQKKPPGKY